MKNTVRRIALLNPFQINSQGYDMDAVRNKGQTAEAPLGLAYISTYLKDHDYEVKVFDAHLMAVKGFTLGRYNDVTEVEDAFIDQVLAYNPDVVGISCSFHFIYKTVHRLAARIKERNNGIIVVIGGGYATCSFETALSFKDVDYAVIGEGEKPFLNLLESINGHKELVDVKGIAYRNNDGQIVANRALDIIEFLDEIDRPDRTDIPVEDYYKYGRHFIQRFEAFAGKEMKIATMTASRGCVFKCTFCLGKSIWGPVLRNRSPKMILDEIQDLKERHGINFIAFNDDNLCINKKFAVELLRGMIDRKLDIKWTTGGISVRTLLDRELVGLMVDSGCLIFNMAVESGCQETLNKINKPVNLDDVYRAVDVVRSFEGTYLLGAFMLGFPEEKEEQFFQTIKFGKSLKCDWILYGCLTPYPGTEIYDEVRSKGMISDNMSRDFEKMTFRNYVINPRHMDNKRVPQEAYFANLDQNFFENPNLFNGRTDIVLSDFENVVKLAPDHSSAYYCIGRILASRGDKEKARLYFIRAKETLSGYHKEYFEKLGIDMDAVLK